MQHVTAGTREVVGAGHHEHRLVRRHLGDDPAQHVGDGVGVLDAEHRPLDDQ
jgi:hypothetical protein